MRSARLLTISENYALRRPASGERIGLQPANATAVAQPARFDRSAVSGVGERTTCGTLLYPLRIVPGNAKDDAGKGGTAGDAAVAPLIEEVYGELRRLADRYVQRERVKSVQATELVHEAYLRLLKDRSPAWRNRTHFLAIAAISRRRLLVERARARAAAKRGGGHVQVTLDDKLLARQDETIDVLAIDRALDGLAKVDAQQARIVELRFFGGLSVEETAEALDVSPATVKRHWSVARAWLWRELEGSRS